VSLRQIVEHDHVVATIEQRQHNVATDKAGAANHKKPLSGK
jgi:hypothetical protein